MPWTQQQRKSPLIKERSIPLNCDMHSLKNKNQTNKNVHATAAKDSGHPTQQAVAATVFLGHRARS